MLSNRRRAIKGLHNRDVRRSILYISTNKTQSKHVRYKKDTDGQKKLTYSLSSIHCQSENQNQICKKIIVKIVAIHVNSHTNSTIIIQSANITSNRAIRESYLGNVAFKDKYIVETKTKGADKIINDDKAEKEYRNSHA